MLKLSIHGDATSHPPHLPPGDPLLIADAVWNDGDPRRYFWTGYVKGAARAATVLVLAKLIMESRADICETAPDLFYSLRAVHCRRGLMSVDRASVALENAKLSARGAIRRAHDVITWLGKLYLLKQTGLDPAAVLKRWNAMATKESQVTGNKRTCCLMLLENAPNAAVQLLLDHVSEFGQESSCFAEDAFANKKIMPGHR